MVEFVSYNGKYPNLCCGKLILRIEGKEVNLDYCLYSGGRVWINDEGYGNVEKGEWSINDVDIPEEFMKYREEITELVNENVPWGCCGGCI